MKKPIITTPINETDKPIFSDRLDIYKHLTDIQSRIRNDITSDFTYAKLNDQDKEFAIEMTNNAYFMQNAILQYIKICKTNKEIEQIIQESRNVFDITMKSVYMLMILNRNVPKNILLQILGGITEKETEDETDEQTTSILEKLKKKLKIKPPEEEI